MKKKTIYIVRHGQTDYNKQHIVQGSGVNSDLNDTGRLQARAFFETYKTIPFDLVITSELIRTHQTMEHFIQAGLPWEKDIRINEMGWGEHEGKKSTPEMMKEYKWMLAEWKNGNYHASVSGGESAFQLNERMQDFVKQLKQKPEDTILVCSHGRAMRCLISILKEDQLFNMENYSHSNTGLYLTDYQPDKFQFQLENDLSHLEAFPIIK